MRIKPLIIILGEPYSTFQEIIFKTYKLSIFSKLRNPIVIVGSLKLFKKQMIKLKYNFKINEISKDEIGTKKLNNNVINFVNVDFKFKNTFDKITTNSKNYINACFKLAIEKAKKNKLIGIINGPVSKKHFLEKKFIGVTEYLAAKTKIKQEPTMLIYNPVFSVCPVTTHLPINQVSKKLSKKKIINDVNNINKYFKKYLNKKPKFAVLGLNPHCETTNKKSEEKLVIEPAINRLKKNKIIIKGPFSADTFFSNKNLSYFDVAIGMYHDQVLTPMKTIFKFDAINLTLGLPFMRVSPDHGTNNQMIGEKKSNPKSLVSCIHFFKKIK